MNWFQKSCNRMEFSDLGPAVAKSLDLLSDDLEPFTLQNSFENQPTPQSVIEQGLPDIRIVNMNFERNDPPGSLLVQLRYGSGQALSLMDIDGRKFPDADELIFVLIMLADIATKEHRIEEFHVSPFDINNVPYRIAHTVYGWIRSWPVAA